MLGVNNVYRINVRNNFQHITINTTMDTIIFKLYLN